jgi:hypothetical protein
LSVYGSNLVVDSEGERRLRVLENRVLRRILGPQRDKVTGDWEILHNKELNELH